MSHVSCTPTGASKWNPIEHRLFSEISKNWATEPLTSYETMLNCIRTTSTQTGLVVTAYLDRKEYPTGLKPDPSLISSLSPQTQHHPTEMELHHCTESVKLILSWPYVNAAHLCRPIPPAPKFLQVHHREEKPLHQSAQRLCSPR
jgi:hypothetical protein